MKAKFNLLFFFFFLLLGMAQAQQTWYVTVAGNGSKDGSSWDNASDNLQNVINDADAGDQIWVAAGSHIPASESYFTLKNGVSIYGGFTGTETNFTQRNPSANVTVLKGNNNRVVYGIGTISNQTHIDGFTISDGVSSYGAGVYLNGTDCTPVFSNCIISNNAASNGGGGVYVTSGALGTFSQCDIKNNTAANGAGVYVYQASDMITSAILDKCKIYTNTAATSGGGVFMYGSSSNVNTLVVTNCDIYSNTASSNYGGGIYIGSSNCIALIKNVKIRGNKANQGGGAYIGSDSVKIVSSLVSGNASNTTGGGINNAAAAAKYINCTIAGNYANSSSGGGGMRITGAKSPSIYNCIIYNNKKSTDAVNTVGGGVTTNNASPIISNSCIQGDITYGFDPLFSSAYEPTTDNTPNLLGSYAVVASSSSTNIIDQGANTYYLDSSAILGYAGATTDTTVSGILRFLSSSIDIGAYEGDVTLPVTFADIKAVKSANAIKVTWTTLTEKNVQYFDIQKSPDGKTFASIGTASSLGNSDKATSYDYTDVAPNSGLNYYRITEVAFDGTSSFSNTVSINYTATPNGNIKVYPNPCIDQINVDLSSVSSIPSYINIYDVSGKTIKTVKVPSGIENMTISVKGIPQGAYFLTIGNYKATIIKK